MVVPISNQLPESRTRKKKFKVITSVVDRTRRKREKGGSSKHRESNERADDNKKNGIKILKTRSAPIRKGLKTVVNR